MTTQTETETPLRRGGDKPVVNLHGYHVVRELVPAYLAVIDKHDVHREQLGET